MMRKSSGKLIRWPGGTTRKEKPILGDLKEAESGMEEGDINTTHTVLADHTTSTMTPGIPLCPVYGEIHHQQPQNHSCP